MKIKPIHAAYERSEVIRSGLTAMGARCIEVTEDKCGILWERWVLRNGNHAVLWSTPDAWEVFLPVASGNSVAETVSALINER
jgi:hypothetical protein